MAETIIDGTLFNANNIQYSAPKANASGGKSINILNPATKSGVRLSRPLVLTWGPSEFEGNGKFEMSLQFPREEYTNADCDAFLKNMQMFEAKIKADALVYSKEWFGKVHTSPDVIEALFTPMLKYSKDKFTGNPDLTKAPTLRIKFPLWEGVWKCLICDEDGNKLFPGAPGVTPLDFIKKGTNLATIMQCGGLWFANGKFGVTWKLAQAVVQKPKATLTDECFIKLKPQEKAKLQESIPLPEDDSFGGDSNNHITTTIVDDSDEDEETQKPEPVVEVKPTTVEDKPTVKKVVKKGK